METLTEAPVAAPAPKGSTPLENFTGLIESDRAVHEEIMHRAYAIWEAKGRPTGCDLANWLEARAEVLRPDGIRLQ